MPETTTRTSWLAVVAVTMGIFSIVTTEILPIGLLTTIGADYGVSDGTAGWLMTIPGLVAAVAAPTVTVATGRVDRRLMLVVLMGLLAVADFLAAVAPSYWLLLVSRVLVGLTIGGFWSIGAGLASRLVPAKAVGRATAVIFSAVPLGSVLGVPAGTLIGDLAGWRTSFVVLGVLTVGVLVALVVLLPPLPAVHVTSLSVLRELVRHRNIRLGLLATVLVVTAHFGTYTYVTAFLEQVTGIGSSVSWFLLAFGIAGVVGNVLAGSAVSRDVRAAFLTSAGLLALATLSLPVIGTGAVGALAALVVWGFAYGAVPACSQTWFARSTTHTEAATVLFTSSFQATISVGALLGGVVVDSTSTSTVLVAGGMVAVLMVVAVLVSSRPGEPYQA
jgi:predicted MFS family arabinose efflux permease